MASNRPLVLGLLALAGCNQILGIGDVKSGAGSADAPPGTPDAMTDAGPFDCPVAPPNTVIGCATITHVLANGTTTKSRKDLSRFTVAAYVADQSASGFHIVNGVARADGTIEIDGVTDGTPYYLRLQDPQEPFYSWPHYFYTDKHDLDLGYTEVGRDDTPATLDTEITLNMTGMTPWKAGDFVNVDSFNAGTSIGMVNPVSPPVPGATTVGLTADWRNGTGEITYADFTDESARPAQLIDQAAQGDDLWAIHQTTKVVSDGAMSPFSVTTIADYAPLTGVTMTDGTAKTIGGPFMAAPAAPNPINLNINPAAFRGAFRDNSRYWDESISCVLSANPGASYGLLQENLLSVSGEPHFPSDLSVGLTLPYTTPLTSTWPQVMVCSYGHVRSAKIPGLTRRSNGFSYISSYTPVTTSFTWTPQLHTVTNLKIGGVDGIAGGAVPFDGVAPVTMAWDAVPGVNHYQVRVKDETLGVFLAVFDTSQTSVTMPADTFTKGNFYVFRVFAIQTAGDYAGGHLFEFKMPLWSARVSTGMFRFSNLCGNGVKDPGEDCDPGTAGSTATCDADCSAVLCGDGFLNAAAGEQCDDSNDSPNCNAMTCKTPVCGDGYWNPRTEECDDGNVVGGDGCSSACKLEHCGDSTVNPGEGCDDGNRINGDGCDAFCQPE